MQHITVIATSNRKPAKRPFVSFRKIGGLYHWRIGNTGGSIYRPGMLIAAALAMTTACAAPIPVASGATYAVILTVANGNEYVVDYGLTLQDCRDAIANEWPDATCINESE